MSRTKTKHRIYCESLDGGVAELRINDERLFHYCLDVLRLRLNDSVTLFDGQGKEALAEIASVEKQDECIVCNILEVKDISSEKQGVTITLCQSILKGKKMDFVLQKCTEIGVDLFFPMFSRRAIVRQKDGVHAGKLKRWQTIVQEASRQSGRSFMPTIMMSASFTEIVKKANCYDLALIPCLRRDAQPLKSVMRGWSGKNILILVGPEGGFEEQEIDFALKHSCIPVSLGDLVLRSETAAIVITAIMRYELD